MWRSEETNAFVKLMFEEAPSVHPIRGTREPVSQTKITEGLFGKQNEVDATFQIDRYYCSKLYRKITARYRKENLSEERILSLLERLRLEMPKPFLASTTGECSICMGETKVDQRIYEIDQCGHCFHTKCMDPWILQGKKTCPMCRHIFLTC